MKACLSLLLILYLCGCRGIASSLVPSESKRVEIDDGTLIDGPFFGRTMVMGCVPDRFDNLLDAVGAMNLVLSTTNEVTRKGAQAQAARYVARWDEGVTNTAQRSHRQTRSPDHAKRMKEDLEKALGERSDHPYAKRVQNAIHELEALIQKNTAVTLGHKEEPLTETIQRAVDGSRELASLAEAAPEPEKKRAFCVQPYVKADGENVEPRRFPRASHVARYLQFRPWSLAYTPIHQRDYAHVETRTDCPRTTDRDGLRNALKDTDPARRGLAAEALATLHQPEDLPLLAALLSDNAESVPVLGRNHNLCAIAMVFPSNREVAKESDPLLPLRSWHQRSVATYARQGLHVITGKEFADEAAFHAWWKENANARYCLWYWQQRIQREMDEAAFTANSRCWNDKKHEDAVFHAKHIETAQHEVIRGIHAELRLLPPEVEAKVRFLTHCHHAGGQPVTGSEGAFWPDPPSLRITPDRLLDLLDRKDAWPELQNDRGLYNLFAERLGLWANVLFTSGHVARLRAALQREHENLWWSGKAALIMGISRLLPAAKSNDLDNPDTRDGILRQAISKEGDIFARGYCAQELVRVGIPDNNPFLRKLFFLPSPESGACPQITHSILQALGQKPLTKAKLDLLLDLVRDSRFEGAWTRYNARMGDDMDRQYAIWSLNAHAGRELIPDELTYALVDPKRSADALKKVYDAIDHLREEKASPTP